MSPSTTAITVNSVLNEALSIMLSTGEKAMPVVSESYELVGVLSFDAIRKALQEAAQTGEAK